MKKRELTMVLFAAMTTAKKVLDSQLPTDLKVTAVRQLHTLSEQAFTTRKTCQSQSYLDLIDEISKRSEPIP